MINRIIDNPIYISTLVVPIINLSILYYYSEYCLLFTAILVSITSILYHHNFKIKYIRNIDICASIINYLQHLYICIFYKDTYVGILIYISIFMLYIIDKILEYYGYLRISNYVHALMHFMLIYSVIHLIF